MVWELIKDSPAWRISLWASLIYATGWLTLSQGNDNGAAISAPILIYTGHMVVVAAAPETAFRCTFFDAALPISGRQLWISKMIVLLGMVWLPVLASSAVGFAVVGKPAQPFLNAAAGYTAILLFAQCFRPREFHEPRWVCLVSLVVGGTVMIVLGVALPEYGARVLAGYLLASAAFFLVGLSRVPKSFEAAPAESSAVRAARAGAGNSTPLKVWFKILRPIYGFYLVIMIALVWVEGGGTFVSALMIVPPVTAMVLGKWRFLAHLPVSPRKLFWAVWAPLPVAIFIGYEAAIYVPFAPFGPMMLGARILAICCALNLGLLGGWMFAFQSWGWHRMRNWPGAVRWVILGAVPVGAAAAWILIPSNDAWRRYGSDPIPYYAVQLAGLLPKNSLLLGALLVVPLVGLYWLAERAFCEMEYPRAAQKSMGEAYLHRGEG